MKTKSGNEITFDQATELYILRSDKAWSWYELAERYSITTADAREIFEAAKSGNLEFDDEEGYPFGDGGDYSLYGSSDNIPTAETIEPEQEAEYNARIAAASVVDAYAKAEGISPADVTAEQYAAAYAVAAAEITGTDKEATEEQRATVDAMVEAIAAAHLSQQAHRLHTTAAQDAAHTVQVITHEDARTAYDLAAEAEEAVPASHTRVRVDARTEAIDRHIKSVARYATPEDAAAYIAGKQADYPHAHTVNLGTSRYPDRRRVYEQHRSDRLTITGTASRTGKSIDRLALAYAVLVID